MWKKIKTGLAIAGGVLVAVGLFFAGIFAGRKFPALPFGAKRESSPGPADAARMAADANRASAASRAVDDAITASDSQAKVVGRMVDEGGKLVQDSARQRADDASFIAGLEKSEGSGDTGTGKASP